MMSSRGHRMSPFPVLIAMLTSNISIRPSLEISLVIICGCIPTVKPIYDTYSQGRAIQPRNYPDKGARQSHSRESKANLVERLASSTNATLASWTHRAAPDEAGLGFGPKDIWVERRVDVDLCYKEPGPEEMR